MPRRPKGEKHSADVIGNAVKVMRIAVGEDSELQAHRQSLAVAQSRQADEDQAFIDATSESD